MPSILHALKEASSLLQTAKVDTPSLDSRILLEYVTGKSRETITGYPETELTDTEYKNFLALIERRAAREPVSHLIGKREFFGLEFKVTRDTLDPRPDSETLIEQALKLFPDKQSPLRILDLGTGTGCLLLTLLSQFPQATGIGVDIHPPALAIAKENSINLGLEKRTRFVLQCWAQGIDEQFDLIITNPPYIKKADLPLLQPEVFLHEPHIALEAGEDGLACYRAIAPTIAPLLKDDGFVILEFGHKQENPLSALLTEHHLETIAYGSDLASIIRCIVAQKIKENKSFLHEPN